MDELKKLQYLSLVSKITTGTPRGPGPASEMGGHVLDCRESVAFQALRFATQFLCGTVAK